MVPQLLEFLAEKETQTENDTRRPYRRTQLFKEKGFPILPIVFLNLCDVTLLRAWFELVRMMLQFRDLAKLRTKKIVFEDVIPVLDPATLEHLKELSSIRKIIEESINETSSISEAIAREMSGGLTSRWEQESQRLERYLSLLQCFVSHVDLAGNSRQIVQWISKLKIRWSSTLSSSSLFSLAGPKFYQIDDVRFELGMALFLYGTILWERALELLPSDLKQSACVFREASGVFHYLAHEVLQSLQIVISTEKPPEAVSSVSSAMSLICLAQAQAVYIKKAEEMGTTSLSILAKLHYGVAELLGEAATIVCTGECKNILPRFMEYISACRALYELRSQMYAAEVLKNDSQIGTGIGVLRDALRNIKQKMPGEDSWKSVFNKEIKHAADALRKFEHENEFVWHDKIATGDALPLPLGHRIVKMEIYHPTKREGELSFKM